MKRKKKIERLRMVFLIYGVCPKKRREKSYNNFIYCVMDFKYKCAFSRVSVSVEMCEISGAINVRSRSKAAAVKSVWEKLQINFKFNLALDNKIIREILEARMTRVRLNIFAQFKMQIKIQRWCWWWCHKIVLLWVFLIYLFWIHDIDSRLMNVWRDEITDLDDDMHIAL